MYDKLTEKSQELDDKDYDLEEKLRVLKDIEKLLNRKDIDEGLIKPLARAQNSLDKKLNKIRDMNSKITNQIDELNDKMGDLKLIIRSERKSS
jgi:vacuolar-type H+-ATPase subunit I/STV1